MIEDWKLKVDHEEDKFEFKGKKRNLKLIDSKGGHHLSLLVLVGIWRE